MIKKDNKKNFTKVKKTTKKKKNQKQKPNKKEIFLRKHLRKTYVIENQCEAINLLSNKTREQETKKNICREK